MYRSHRRVLILLLVGFLLILGVPFLTLVPLSTSYAPDFNTSADGALPDGIDTTLVWVTAYSSSVNETNDNPFQTASQTPPRDGVIAANFLTFGTLVTIPELFGDKVFVVEDRLHRSKKWVVDVWMPSKEAALEFGSHLTNIVVIQRPAS